MGLHMPGLARRGVAVVRLRGVLTGVGTGRLTDLLRPVFACDPRLLVVDLGGLRGWNESGQRHLADIADYLTARNSQMVLTAAGAHLPCSELGVAALETFSDVPSALAAGKRTDRPGPLPPRGGIRAGPVPGA
jgi:anti-anti-sigma regulatory factor